MPSKKVRLLNFRQLGADSADMPWAVYATLVDLDGQPLFTGTVGWLAAVIQAEHYQLVQVNGNTLPLAQGKAS